MASWDVLLAFAVATAIFAAIPGPAMLYTAAQTLARGRRGGLMAALGLHLGGYVHVIAASLGLSLVFRHVPEAYLAVKLGGAAYLVWLGFGLMRPKKAGEGAAMPVAPKRASLWQSIVVELLNPKTAIFFLAFLPQFVAPEGSLPVWLQFLILGTVTNLVLSSADIVVVLLAGTVQARLKRSSVATRIAQILGGTVLVGLGARLALEAE